MFQFRASGELARPKGTSMPQAEGIAAVQLSKKNGWGTSRKTEVAVEEEGGSSGMGKEGHFWNPFSEYPHLAFGAPLCN